MHELAAEHADRPWRAILGAAHDIAVKEQVLRMAAAGEAQRGHGERNKCRLSHGNLP
jgi:hypothetical protein